MLSTLRAIGNRVFKRSSIQLLWRVARTQGLAGIWLRAGILVRQGFAYGHWVRTHDQLSAADRRAIALHLRALAYQPLLSVLLPTFDTPEKWLRKAIDSVRQQCYTNWELCIADDASTTPHVARVLKEYAQLDPRIRILLRPDNGHISASTNSAMAMARGEFVALLDHDDELAPHALYLVVANLNANPRYDLLYSDEDKMDAQGRRFDPYFKPAWNAALLESQNLVSHLGVYRTELLRGLGGFRSGVEGCQDWDVALRCSERIAPQNICHIPFVLYHWRAVDGSTAVHHGHKDYVKRAAQRVVQEHMERLQESACVVPSVGSFVHPVLALPMPTPSVSVLVWGSSAPAVPVPDCTLWPALEVLPCTPLHSESLAQSINRVVRQAQGELLCLLRSDLQVDDAQWLQELVRQACRAGVGSVGPMHLDAHGNIRHAAIVLCARADAAMPFHSPYQGLDSAITGVAGRAALTQHVSALAPGCLVLRAATWRQVHGLDAGQFPQTHFELDLCLRLAQSGYNNVWTPQAKVRSQVDPKSYRTAADADEASRFRSRWQQVLQSDPSHSPNMTLDSIWPGPAFPPRKEIPWLPYLTQEPARDLP